MIIPTKLYNRLESNRYMLYYTYVKLFFILIFLTIFKNDNMVWKMRASALQNMYPSYLRAYATVVYVVQKWFAKIY